jgi:type II secretory pathway predicted ATPase ExeA
MTQASATHLLKQGLFAAPAVSEDIYRNTALDMLASSVLQQTGNTAQIQVIKGEQGLGKTTFCRRLLLEAGSDLSITPVITDRKTGIAEILHVLAGGKEEDTRAPLQVLAKNAAQKIYQQLYNGLQPVALIDDAHYLSAQTLANLFRFQNAIAQQHSGGLKLILVGERRIDSRIERVDSKVIDRDRFLSALLRPLNRNEIGDYIDFKFARVQGDKPRLNNKQLQYVRKNSGGIPGRIEELCLRALQGKTFSKARALTALLAVALVAGGLGYHYRDLLLPEGKPARVASAPKTSPPRVGEKTIPPAATSEPAAVPESIPDITQPAPSTESPESLAWLTEQPAEFYLIQLVGSGDRAKMETYKESLTLPHPLTLHKTQRNRQDWYLLFYGPFPDYESALDARAELPADLRKNQPWIRQIGSILEKQ